MENVKKSSLHPEARRYEAPEIQTMEMKLEKGIADSLYYIVAPGWEDDGYF